MRIAYLANPRTGNGIYRGMGPMQSLRVYHGHDVRQLEADEDAPPPLAQVRDVDVLHVHRFCEDRAQALAREASAHGVAVVWDNDDDIGTIPKSSATHRQLGGLAWSRRLQAMKRIFRVADLVTTPSETLAERLRGHGAPRTTVIENFVQDHFRRVDRRPHCGVTIGWVVGLEHQVDVERIPIRETLQRLLDERPDVQVMTFGLRLGLRSDRYRHNDGVPLIELCDSIVQFDIGIAPISNVEFNRARSNIKLKEYASVGVPWLASPIGPYAGMDEKQGGRLVPDDQWYEELTRLVDKPRERRKLAKRARKWAAGETLSKNVRIWERAFVDVLEHRKAA